MGTNGTVPNGTFLGVVDKWWGNWVGCIVVK